MGRILIALALGVTLALPARAAAGTYTVYQCHYGGHDWGSAAFVRHPSPGYLLDDVCEPGNTDISVNVNAPAGGIAGNTSAALTFAAPPGDTIASFRVRRSFRYADAPARGSHPLYELARLGPTVYEGAGNYADAVVSALRQQGRWYATNRNWAFAWRSTADFPALADYGPTHPAGTLSMEVGCYPRGTPCALPAGGIIDYAIKGAAITVADSRPPDRLDVAADGLLSGGAKVGFEPVTVSAHDPAGIRIAQLLDVTDAAHPRVVAQKDYAHSSSDAGAGCFYGRAAPCPTLADETLAPSGLPAGTRRLEVRVVDPAGNALTRGPYTVTIAPPVNRGPVNGSGATETGTLSLRFAHGHRLSRTVDYGAHVTVEGRLTNASGAPIAGARVELITEDMRLGAHWKRRATVTTSRDGRFSRRVTAAAARRLQFGWKSHVDDHFYAAHAEVRLWARASARLKVAPHVVLRGHRIRLSGRVRGYRFPAHGKLIELQAYERGRWRTFATARTGRHGRFGVHYRFTVAGGGERFAFRVRIRRESTFAYSLGYSNHQHVRVI